jgi:hypothetical protein
MIIQLNPTIPVEVIDKGKGFAVGWVDYSQGHDLIWIVALNDSGEMWCVPNKLIRLQKNWTLGVRPNETFLTTT